MLNSKRVSVAEDTTTDYRFVVAVEDLNNEAKEVISDLEVKYDFKQNLRGIL